MKRLFSLFLATLMIFSFAACGKKTDETPSDPGVPPELYVGEGFRTILSTLMTGNFNIVEKVAVFGRLPTDENGRVSEPAERDYAIDSYESLLTLFRSVYTEEQAKKLIEKCGYYEKDGVLYSDKKAKDEGTYFDLSSMKTDVTAKDDETCSFTVTVIKVNASGKQKEKTIKCKAAYENGTWLLEDMYY
ncbi:MAG: hypothetical protein IJK60_01510 [Clostridia bacterium]|nr:hypothetical protein [Clostridia bacterium]